MLTKGDPHQLEGAAFLAERFEYAALGAEQGTGKTWMFLSDIERSYLLGDIDCALVIAPNGVHTNWTRIEIPLHLGEEVAETRTWYSGLGKKATRHLYQITEPQTHYGDKLRIALVNYESLISEKCMAFCRAFLNSGRCRIVLDESHYIMNSGSVRSKQCKRLGALAVSRRIGSGTLSGNGPQNVFSQFQFLGDGEPLLGTTSERAFIAEYCQLLPIDHPIMQAAMSRTRRGVPQIIARDGLNRPIYKNLPQLIALMAPHTFVVDKSVLNLKPKQFHNVYFQLSPKERKAYEELRESLYYVFQDGSEQRFEPLTVRRKLAQITSGFILTEEGDVEMVKDSNALAGRVRALKTAIETHAAGKQFIVWTNLKEEVKLVLKALEDLNISAVEYHGDTPRDQRAENIDLFQAGKARAFVANQQAGGTGLTLTAATVAIFFSNEPSIITRKQAEDRNHRRGTTEQINYVDLVAPDTLDEDVAITLQQKGDLAKAIMGGIQRKGK